MEDRDQLEKIQELICHKTLSTLFCQEIFWFLEQEQSYYFLPLGNKYLNVIRASLVNQWVKDLPTNAGDLGLVPGSGRSPEGRNGNPL